MKKFLPKTKYTPQGFTLVELLVVVSIIAILSVIGIVVFTGVQKNSRDARRKADIDAIATALESDFATNNRTQYQAVTSGMFANGIPADPGTYTYSYPAAAAATYCVCAQLENTAGGNFAAACAAGTTHYCRKNQQ